MDLDRCPELVPCQEVDKLETQCFCGCYIEIPGQPDAIIPDCQDIGAIVFNEAHRYHAGCTPDLLAVKRRRERIFEGIGQELVDDQTGGSRPREIKGYTVGFHTCLYGFTRFIGTDHLPDQGGKVYI